MTFEIVLWILSGIVAAIVAAQKNRNAFGWLILGFFFGLFALIAVACLPKLPPKQLP